MTQFGAMFDRESVVNMSTMISAGDLEQRAILAGSGGKLTIQDQIDWGEAFLRDGHVEEARLLFQAALIQRGFSRHIAVQPSLLARVGLPDEARRSTIGGASGRNTVDLAIDELRILARSLAPQLFERVSIQPPRHRTAAGLHPTAVQRRAATKPSAM